jgi:hypothetical protein
MDLRANRATNPGLPDMPKKIRSTAEVQQEKKKKAQKKQETEEKRRKGIVKAAIIENRMVEEDNVRAQNANRPPPTEEKKIPRPRIEKPAVVDEPGKFVFHLSFCLAMIGMTDPDTVRDPCSDGRGSSDEYQPATTTNWPRTPTMRSWTQRTTKLRSPPSPERARSLPRAVCARTSTPSASGREVLSERESARLQQSSKYF